MSRARDALRSRVVAVTAGAPLLPLAVLFALNGVDELSRTAFVVVLPNIRRHFGLDLQGVLTLVSLIGIAVLLLETPVAFYADRLRRVPIALAGAAAVGVFSFGVGLAPAVPILALAMAGSGLGRSVVNPAHNSLLADYYEPAVRAKVYGAHRAANSLGQLLGPLLGGVIAFYLGWRAPFLFFAAPALLLVWAGRRLREPVRGGHERRLAGGSEEVVAVEETPPSFAEAWRTVWSVRTLRRIWQSLPFLAVALGSLPALTSLVYEEIYHLNEVQRGVISAATEPAQILGILVGIPLATRLMNRDPGLALKLLGVAATIQASLLIGYALAPNLAVALAMHIPVSAVGAVLSPGIAATLSFVIPPRVRSLGYAVGSLWLVPGLLVLPIVGGLGDAWGLRRALLVVVPVLLVGAWILASAGRSVRSDVSAARASSRARAELLAARRQGDSKLLLVRDLDVAYDGVQVLFGVDFEVAEGEIVALLGTNGAGKSTLLKALSGLVEPSGGAIVFDGRDTTFVPPHEIVARGVVHIPGGRGICPTLTVGEHFTLAAWPYRNDPEHVRRSVDEAVRHFPVLRERWGQAAGNLSGGEQQMLSLSMALVARPRLLMIDELSLGLAPVVVESLLGIVRAIHQRGTTVILVEQSVNVALTLAEKAYFMEKGEIRFHGPTRQLLARPDILRAVFLEGAAAALRVSENGGRAKSRAVASARGGGAVRTELILEGRELVRTFGGVRAVDDISFAVARGEILGLIGPNGSGKTTVLDVLSGFLPPESGSIHLGGVEITEWSPDLRAVAGLGRSFQHAWIFPGLTVAEAIGVALERHLTTRDPLAAAFWLPAHRDAEHAVRTRVDELIEQLGLGAFAGKLVRELSTGTRRIVDIACSLAHHPAVLLLDEPSSGIAQKETEALGPLLLSVRQQTGASLLVVEHDMPLITSIADRLIALETGSVIAEGGPRDVVRDPRVVVSYLGGNPAAIARSGRRSRARRRA